MIDERTELLIAQYVDGTLPAEQRPAVEAQLVRDEEAREVANQYRSLDEALRSTMPLPQINWDRLSTHISQTLADEEDVPVRTYKLPWVRTLGKVAVAAAVLWGIGLVIRLGQPLQTPSPEPTNAVAVVAGPSAEAPAGPEVQQIEIGPSAALARGPVNWRFAEGVIAEPTRVVIASGYQPAQDTDYQRQ